MVSVLNLTTRPYGGRVSVRSPPRGGLTFTGRGGKWFLGPLDPYPCLKNPNLTFFPAPALHPLGASSRVHFLDTLELLGRGGILFFSPPDP